MGFSLTVVDLNEDKRKALLTEGLGDIPSFADIQVMADAAARRLQALEADDPDDVRDELPQNRGPVL